MEWTRADDRQKARCSAGFRHPALRSPRARSAAELVPRAARSASLRGPHLTHSPASRLPSPTDLASTSPRLPFAQRTRTAHPGRRRPARRVLQQHSSLSAPRANFGIVQKGALRPWSRAILHPSPPQCAVHVCRDLTLANLVPRPSHALATAEQLQSLTATGVQLETSSLIAGLLCDVSIEPRLLSCQVAGCDAGRVASQLPSIFYITPPGHGRVGHDQPSRSEFAG